MRQGFKGAFPAIALVGASWLSPVVIGQTPDAPDAPAVFDFAPLAAGEIWIHEWHLESTMKAETFMGANRVAEEMADQKSGGKAKIRILSHRDGRPDRVEIQVADAWVADRDQPKRQQAKGVWEGQTYAVERKQGRLVVLRSDGVTEADGEEGDLLELHAGMALGYGVPNAEEALHKVLSGKPWNVGTTVRIKDRLAKAIFHDLPDEPDLWKAQSASLTLREQRTVGGEECGLLEVRAVFRPAGSPIAGTITAEGEITVALRTGRWLEGELRVEMSGEAASPTGMGTLTTRAHITGRMTYSMRPADRDPAETPHPVSPAPSSESASVR